MVGQHCVGSGPYYETGGLSNCLWLMNAAGLAEISPERSAMKMPNLGQLSVLEGPF